MPPGTSSGPKEATRNWWCVNPTFIAGPSLVAELRSTLSGFKAIIEGTMPALPRQRFGVVDVRDVAEAHITAMATPAAAGKRYLLLADGPTITWLELAQVLRDHLGAAGEHVTTAEALVRTRRR